MRCCLALARSRRSLRVSNVDATSLEESLFHRARIGARVRARGMRIESRGSSRTGGSRRRAIGTGRHPRGASRDSSARRREQGDRGRRPRDRGGQRCDQGNQSCRRPPRSNGQGSRSRDSRPPPLPRNQVGEIGEKLSLRVIIVIVRSRSVGGSLGVTRLVRRRIGHIRRRHDLGRSARTRAIAEKIAPR